MLRHPVLKELLPGSRCCTVLQQPAALFTRSATSSSSPLNADHTWDAPQDRPPAPPAADTAAANQHDTATPQPQHHRTRWQDAVSSVFRLRPSVLSPLHSVHRRNEETDVRQQLVQARLHAHSLLNQLPIHLDPDSPDQEEAVLTKLTERSQKFTALMETYQALAAKDALPACTSPEHMYAYYSLLSQQAHASDRDATGSHLVNSGQADVWQFWEREFQQRYGGVPSLEPVEAIYNKETMDAELERLRHEARAMVRRSMQEPKRVSSRPASGWFEASGKRKTSVANVRLQPGQGSIVVNGRPYDQYFADITCRSHMLKPLLLTGTAGKYDVVVDVGGGGPSGQAQAVAHGISKALARCAPDLAKELGRAKLLARDPRVVERKKPGLKKARKAFAWVKR